ncbi:MAG TPA: glycosyltransferase [Candidatus Binatia bacterium]|nr:glycosyltransferase [Candidatus Binatia bacterium]
MTEHLVPTNLAEPERVARLAGGVSIVMAMLNHIEYTRKCLASILQHSDLPFEIICVDNGSTDHSSDMARGLGCRVIRNEENLGCARAWNQGIRAAVAPLIIVMNNDIVVTSGWLSGLVDFRRRCGAAVVSPVVINGECDYDLETYRRDYTRKFAARSRPGWAAMCFLTSADTFASVGLFDEQFLGFGFEDEDWDIRLGRARIPTAITGSVLIHHFHQITTKNLAGDKWKKVKNPNKTVLENKWGWRLTLRRIRKELQKFANRLRYPGFHGRNPYDVLTVLDVERLDLERGVKVRR